MISKTKKQGPWKIMKNKYQNISKISKKELRRKFCPMTNNKLFIDLHSISTCLVKFELVALIY